LKPKVAEITTSSNNKFPTFNLILSGLIKSKGNVIAHQSIAVETLYRLCIERQPIGATVGPPVSFKVAEIAEVGADCFIFANLGADASCHLSATKSHFARLSKTIVVTIKLNWITGQLEANGHSPGGHGLRNGLAGCALSADRVAATGGRHR
jgi:hypothetical protein